MHNIIGEYISNGEYNSLVRYVLNNSEYNQKDFKDIYKYLKCIDKVNHITSSDIISLRLRAEDYDVIKEYDLGLDSSSILILAILNVDNIYKLTEYIPDWFFSDYSFIVNCYRLHDNMPETFFDKILAKMNFKVINTIWSMANEIDTFSSEQYEIKDILSIIIQKDIGKLKKILNLLKGDNDKLEYVHAITKELLNNRVRLTSSEIVEINLIYNTISIIDIKVIKNTFESICEKFKSEIDFEALKIILTHGFKRITGGFNKCVIMGDIEAVKMILPFKPRLLIANKYCNNNKDLFIFTSKIQELLVRRKKA